MWFFYLSQILLVALCSCWYIMWDHVRDNCYCSLSKWGLQFFFFLSVALWQLQFDCDDSWGSETNWTRDQEQTERTKSATHIYLSHSPRRDCVCAADPLQKITCMREWPFHFARRHRMWHRSKWALITRTNKTPSFHLNSPNNLHITDWAQGCTVV